MPHHCHAHGCDRRVPPSMFMCGKHWFSLRAATRASIWREYRPGQENTKDPSARYMAVQRRAVAEAAFKPNDEAAAATAARYLADAEAWRQIAVERGEGDPFAALAARTTEAT
jgi:hypothetical protein